jgi:hypothetical protein
VEIGAAADASCDPGFNCLDRSATLFVSTDITYRWDIESGLARYDEFYYGPDADSTVELITPYYSLQTDGGKPRSDVGECLLVVGGEKYPARGGNNRKVLYRDDSLGFLSQDLGYDPRFLINAEPMELIRELREQRPAQQTLVYLECSPINGFAEPEKFYVNIQGDYTPEFGGPNSQDPAWQP